MHETLVSRIVSFLFKQDPAQSLEWSPWVIMPLGFLFGVSVMVLLILCVKYFLAWGHEEIRIIRGRDSFGSFYKDPSSGRKSRERRSLGHRRRLVRGIDRRKR